jgi:hypothetical protein
MDGPQQGLAELDLLMARPHALTIPGSIITPIDCMSKATDGPSMDKCRKEKQRFQSNLYKEVGERMYSVTLRKTKHRALIQKRY